MARRWGEDGDAGEAHTWLHVLNAGLLALLWLFSVIAWDLLPEQVPAHVGLRGVTRWVPRTSGAWFMLPILGTFSAGLMYLLAYALSGSAQAINVPQKKRLLALSPEGQRWVLRPVKTLMLGMAAWVLTLMCWLQWMLYTAARAGPDWRQDAPWLISAAILVLLPIVAAARLGRVIVRRVDEWEASGGGAVPR